MRILLNVRLNSALLAPMQHQCHSCLRVHPALHRDSALHLVYPPLLTHVHTPPSIEYPPLPMHMHTCTHTPACTSSVLLVLMWHQRCSCSCLISTSSCWHPVFHRNPDHIFMVMEYMDHDLKSLMDDKQQFSRPFSVAESKCLMQQLLAGVSFLHQVCLRRGNSVHLSMGVLEVLYQIESHLCQCKPLLTHKVPLGPLSGTTNGGLHSIEAKQVTGTPKCCFLLTCSTGCCIETSRPQTSCTTAKAT